MSGHSPKIMTLIPAYNEARNIQTVIKAAFEALRDALIVVVDDGSSDDTANLARNAGAIVLSHPFNMGYGVALQTGYKFALKNGIDFVVQIDADGQHDPTCIPKVLNKVLAGECDVCIGSRFLVGQTYTIPFLRRVGMFFLRRIASLILKTTITDPTSGFQAMNRRTLEFFVNDFFPTDYPDTDVLILLHKNQFRIIEVPVVMFPSQDKKSLHRGFRPVYYLFKMALDIPLNMIRKEI